MPDSIVVLVIEDHPELRDVLMDALDWEGFEVVTARDEASVTRIVRARGVDLVVADPPSFAEAQGGFDALRTVERLAPDLPTIVIADDTPGQVYFAPWTTSGRRRTLRRPFRLSDLVAACREAVGDGLDQLEEQEEGV